MEMRIWRGSNMFLAFRLRIICNILNSSCSKREGTEGPFDNQGLRHTDAIVWTHVIVKQKAFRCIFLPKKVQEIHQKAAEILPNYKHYGNEYKDRKN